MESKYIRYYYFGWKDGKPELSKLAQDGETAFETPNSKDGVYDGWSFIVSNAKLTSKDLDVLESFDVHHGCTYKLDIRSLKEFTVHGDAKNTSKILTEKKKEISCVYKIRVVDDSTRQKLRGKFRAKDTAYSGVGRIFKRKNYLNASLKRWPLGDDEEIVVFEMTEKETLSGSAVKYGIKK